MGVRRGKIPRRLIGAVLIVLVAFVAVLPSLILPPVVQKVVRANLNRPALGISCETVTADLGWLELVLGGATVSVGGRCRELPFDVRVCLGFCWKEGPSLWFRSRAAVDGTGWKVLARGDAGWRGWQAEMTLPEVSFTERDPVVAEAVGLFVPPAVSNLTVSGSVACTAVASRLNWTKATSWKAKLPLRDFSAACDWEGESYALEALSLTPIVSGLDAHVDVEPTVVRARALTATGFSLTNLFAEVRADAKSVMVTEAGARCCGGHVRLYALRLDPKTLSGGVSLYLENVEAGEVLHRFRGFKGDCSGPLNGKLSLVLTEDGRLRIRDAYLQSPSGATGKLQLDEDSALNDTLSLSGLDEATSANLRRALANLDYNVLKFDIRREAAHTLALNVRVEGTAHRGSASAPVSLNVTFRGDIEQLLNTGIKLTGKGKETKR